MNWRTAAYTIAFMLSSSLLVHLHGCYDDVNTAKARASIEDLEIQIADLEARLATVETNDSSQSTDIAGLDTLVAANTAAENGTQIIVLKDVKGEGTGGGTNVADQWQVRDLNTIENPYDHTWVSGPNSNNFSLSAGTYSLSAICPAHRVDHHKCNLVDTSNSVDIILGTSAYADASLIVNNDSILEGIFSISEETNFEIQHITASVYATNGLGVEAGSNLTEPSGSEIYTIVKIKRLSD